MLSSLLAPLLFLLYSSLTQAVLVNVTIDDTNGDPHSGAQIIYDPPAAWLDAQACKCINKKHGGLQSSKLVGQSLHKSVFSTDPAIAIFPNQALTASVTFNGSAVYVNCVLDRDASGRSDMTFSIDGAVADTFKAEPADSTGFEYNTIVFSATDLVPGFHVLTMQNGHAGGPEAIMILDSVIYSFDNGLAGIDESSSSPLLSSSAPSSPSSQSALSPNLPRTHVGAIVTALVVILILTSLGTVAFVLHRRRRRRRAIYAPYMPKGAVRAFPMPAFASSTLVSARPRHQPAAPGDDSRPQSEADLRIQSWAEQTAALAPLPPVYARGKGWTGSRDQKHPSGPHSSY